MMEDNGKFYVTEVNRSSKIGMDLGFLPNINTMNLCAQGLKMSQSLTMFNPYSRYSLHKRM